MTNELERLEAETRKALGNPPDLEIRVTFYGGAIPNSGAWVALKPTTILALIQRVKEARAAGRAEALEEAAKRLDDEAKWREEAAKYWAAQTADGSKLAANVCAGEAGILRAEAAAIRALGENAGC